MTAARNVRVRLVVAMARGVSRTELARAVEREGLGVVEGVAPSDRERAFRGFADAFGLKRQGRGGFVIHVNPGCRAEALRQLGELQAAIAAAIEKAGADA